MSQTSPGRALVTGGAGFLGPQLIKRLLRKDWCVLTIDNLFNGSRDHLEPFAADPAFTFVQGDITDGDFLTRTVGQFEPDAVFHLAALHFIPYCIAHPADTLRVNVIATQLLLDALKGTHVRSFVLASTADVYAASERSHSEGDPLGTTNIYGVTKMTAEQLLKLAQMRYPESAFLRQGVPISLGRARPIHMSCLTSWQASGTARCFGWGILSLGETTSM